MTDYTITTNFGAKDSLPSGNAGKVIKGSEFTTEFTNIQTAVNTKADTAGDTFTGAVNFSADVAVNTNTLFVDVSEAKVGIGYTSPDSKLDVAGVIKGGDVAATGGGTALSVKYTTGHTLNNFGATFSSAETLIGFGVESHKSQANKFISTASNSNFTRGALTLDDELKFFNAAATTTAVGSEVIMTERMRIDSSGKVGIGTSSPDTLLDVVGADPILTIRDTSTSGADSHATLRLAESDGSGNVNVRFDVALDEGDLTFDYSNGATTSERMRIDALGNLLVGTTSVTAMGTTNTGVVLRDNDSSYFARNSNGSIIAFFSGLGGAGTISLTGNTANYNTTSDERLKENIADSDDAGSKVDAIQIRQFDWKADGSHQDYGVIAQELVEVAPEAVSEGDTEEDMMGVDYSKLVPMLIKEVQSLRSRVAELENV